VGQGLQWIRYGAIALGLTLAMAIAKGGAAWAMDRYVYSLPVLGGWLESLELVELSNVLVLALLGVGLGAATRWLPRSPRWWQRVLVLGLSVPVVFLSSYGVRQALWVQEVAATSNIPLAQATLVTDRLLLEATGREGLPGFFLYTVRSPLLPTELSALTSLNEEDQWFRSELTRYSGVEPGLFALIFRLTGWGIRLVYIGLAAITAIIYFARGILWANARRPTFPPPPPPVRRPAPAPGSRQPQRPRPPSPSPPPQS
jgi:hypothetical protein